MYLLLNQINSDDCIVSVHLVHQLAKGSNLITALVSLIGQSTSEM